jgi:hypothetical protein
MKSTFFSEGQVNMYGKGRLEIRGKNKHAICTDDYFRMYEGDVRIKEAASDGIHANDEIVIESGALAIRSTGDGLESEKDMIQIKGGHSTASVEIIHIESATDKEVLTLRLPKTYNRKTTLLFSSPSLAGNTNYTVSSAGNTGPGGFPGGRW